MLNSKYTKKYIYSYDNTLKFKKNEEVDVINIYIYINNAKMYLRNVSKYLKVKMHFNKC